MLQLWYPLDLNDWRKYEQPGDKYLPFRQYIRKFTQTQFEYPGDKVGRGIVIAGGGRFLPGIWVTINLLRQFGCKLPIELWHLGPDELPEIYKSLLAPMDVQFVDAFEVRKLHPCSKLGGWQLKPYALILSRFEQVLFLDADNHPVKDPTYLFDMPEYQKMGAVFWPDRIGYPQNATTWDVWGIAPRELAQHETGQMLINKRICWHALQLAMHANSFSDFHYQHSWGDTATYQFALLSLNQPYYTILHRLLEVPIEREVEDIEGLKIASYMRQSGDIRAMFLQRDHNGEVIFQHRSGGGGAQAAFKLGEKKHIQHFQHEQFAFDLLDELETHIKSSGDLIAEIITLDADKISPHRRNGILRMLKLAEECGAKTMVECGTLRQENNWHNDGGFTWFLAKYAARDGGILHTIDIAPAALAIARKVTAPLAANIRYVESDSIKFLQGFTEPIDLLLLDSVDYHAGQERQAQAQVLKEAFAALPRLHANSIIVIDDCALAGGGKGGMAVPYLLAEGWRIDHQEYMTILIKG